VLWGRELATAGVNLNFAPVLDVVPPGTDAQNEPIGALRRGYGHDPATVSAHALAFMRGMSDAGVGTTAKHFPGLGRVTGNTDFTATVVDDVTTRPTRTSRHFRDAIGAGIPMVMVALAKYQKIDPNELAVFSTPVMRNLLRDSLNFTGVVVSMTSVRPSRSRTSRLPIVRSTSFQPAAISSSRRRSRRRTRWRRDRGEGRRRRRFQVRVDDAALRVLRLKVARGLVRCG